MKAALERTPCHHTAPKLILGNILVGSAWTVFERAPLLLARLTVAGLFRIVFLALCGGVAGFLAFRSV